MSDRYSHIVRAVLDEPWAILPAKFAQIIELVELRAAGLTLSEADIEARVGGGRERPDTTIDQGVGIIPMFGVLAQRMNLFSRASGGTSTEELAAEFHALVGDPQVKAILFAIDSPGGSVYGIPELAAAIRDARGIKPIEAVASSLAASAAYWLGAQTDKLSVTPSGDVGSVGVISAHTDLSAAAAKTGVKTTYIASSKYKAEGNPYEPLSEEARAYRQARVDQLDAMFVSDLAKGRRIAESTVRDKFGQGRLVSAADALATGMVDAVATFESVLQRLQQLPTPSAVQSPRARASVNTPQEPQPAATGQDSRRLPEALWRDLMALELKPTENRR
jgi:signal peptide peptidase SppA